MQARAVMLSLACDDMLLNPIASQEAAGFKQLVVPTYNLGTAWLWPTLHCLLHPPPATAVS